MQPILPRELVFLILKSLDLGEETPTLLDLLLVSRGLKSIAEPLLYKTVRFQRSFGNPGIRLVKLRSFLKSISKNDGALGAHVREFTLTSPPYGLQTGEVSNFWAIILKILPFLTRLTHFELTVVSGVPQHVTNSIFSLFRTSQLSAFVWDAEGMGETKVEEDFTGFLRGQPSIEHLEIPSFTLSSPIPSTVLLPRLKKLVIHSYHCLFNHPALKLVTHLGLMVTDNLALDRIDVEGLLPQVQYLAALDGFDAEEVLMLSSRLPNLRCLVCSPLFTTIEEFLEEARKGQFQGKKLEYLALSCTVDDEETVGEVITDIFNTLSTLRIIDFQDYGHGYSESTRYLVDGMSSVLTLLEHSKYYWPTEVELNQMLSQAGPGCLTRMVDIGTDSMDPS